MVAADATRQCISIERWRSPHKPKIAPHRCKLFPAERFCFPGIYPETINRSSIWAAARDASQWDRAPILRFEITLCGFSNCQRFPSIIEHSSVMQWMQVDKASNFPILLAVKIDQFFKAFRTDFLCKQQGAFKSDDSATCAKGCIASQQGVGNPDQEI